MGVCRLSRRLLSRNGSFVGLGRHNSRGDWWNAPTFLRGDIHLGPLTCDKVGILPTPSPVLRSRAPKQPVRARELRTNKKSQATYLVPRVKTSPPPDTSHTRPVPPTRMVTKLCQVRKLARYSKHRPDDRVWVLANRRMVVSRPRLCQTLPSVAQARSALPSGSPSSTLGAITTVGKMWRPAARHDHGCNRELDRDSAD